MFHRNDLRFSPHKPDPSFTKFRLPGREAAFYPAREAGAPVFGLEGSPVGRSLWGKPGLGGFEPARGGAPIEAAVWC